jgi:nucleoside diphosphate kinase
MPDNKTTQQRHATPVQSLTPIEQAVAKLRELYEEARAKDAFHGTLRVEIVMQAGRAVVIRSNPDQTIKL